MEGRREATCDWGGKRKLFFYPPIPHHIFTHTPLPPVYHHHHWYPTEKHDAAHLVCQPSHFRCCGNIFQDGSLRARPYSRRSSRVFVRLLAWSTCLPVGSTDGTRGSCLKKDEKRGQGRRRRRWWQFRIDRFSPFFL